MRFSLLSFFVFVLLVCNPIITKGQDTLRIGYLPEGRLFENIYLDPNEAQVFGTVATYWQEKEFREKVFLPLGLGFYKGLIRWGKERKMEIGFDLAAQFQFQFIFPDGKMQRNLLDTDYKISLLYHAELSDHQQLRIRFYHISSHLGDDYMIRNGVNSYFPNPNNYEQLDATWSIKTERFRYYGGLGMVVRPETIRKRFSAHLGSTFDYPLNSKIPTGLVGGLHVRLLAENNYNPGMKAGLGLRLGNKSNNPLLLLFEFYRGNMPYGPFEFTKVQWLGLGIYISP